MNETNRSSYDRRTVVVVSGSAMVGLAGCLGGSEPSGPQNRSYTLTITRPEDTLELQIDPAGDVADVIQIHVGDTIEFTIINESDIPVGFHNHANDAEIVIEPGAQREMGFEATEAMTGRQEIEGWVVDAEDGGEGADDGHGGGATALAIIEVRPRGS